MNVVLWGCVIILVAAVLGAGGAGLWVGWKLVHPARKDVDTLPEAYGIRAYEEVSFLSRAPVVTLSGWYIRAEANGAADSGRTVIFAHGYGQNRLEPHLPALALAARLVSAGFDVLMFDFRNAGRSGGSVTTVGYWEQADLLGAIDFVEQRHPGRAIHLLGFSMGAATALLVAAADERVRSVAADSPFYSLWEYLRENLPHWTGLPRFPFNAVILTLIPLLIGAHPRRVSPCRAVRRIAPRPVLLIHGTADETVPAEDSVRLQREAGHASVQLWLVPGAGHVRSYARQPEAYEERILRFFTQGEGDACASPEPDARLAPPGQPVAYTDSRVLPQTEPGRKQKQKPPDS